jgi:hypothetical protein
MARLRLLAAALCGVVLQLAHVVHAAAPSKGDWLTVKGLSYRSECTKVGELRIGKIYREVEMVPNAPNKAPFAFNIRFFAKDNCLKDSLLLDQVIEGKVRTQLGSSTTSTIDIDTSKNEVAAYQQSQYVNLLLNCSSKDKFVKGQFTAITESCPGIDIPGPNDCSMMYSAFAWDEAEGSLKVAQLFINTTDRKKISCTDKKRKQNVSNYTMKLSAKAGVLDKALPKPKPKPKPGDKDNACKDGKDKDGKACVDKDDDGDDGLPDPDVPTGPTFVFIGVGGKLIGVGASTKKADEIKTALRAEIAKWFGLPPQGVSWTDDAKVKDGITINLTVPSTDACGVTDKLDEVDDPAKPNLGKALTAALGVPVQFQFDATKDNSSLVAENRRDVAEAGQNTCNWGKAAPPPPPPAPPCEELYCMWWFWLSLVAGCMLICGLISVFIIKAQKGAEYSTMMSRRGIRMGNMQDDNPVRGASALLVTRSFVFSFVLLLR